MPGGPFYLGARTRQAEPERVTPALDWSRPLQPLAKKGTDETLTTKVGYKVAYVGPVTNSAYTSGITSPVQIEQDGITYNGTMNIKLTKITGDSAHVDFRLTLSIPQLDSKTMVWDTKDLGQPASIKRENLLKYTIIADKLYTDNDKFNATMKDGDTLTRDILSGSATLSFYRIPGETPVEETGPVRTQGLLMTAMASGDNLRLSIEAPAGTPLDIKIYNMQGQVVQQLGAPGMTTNQHKETLNYTIDPSLASGSYFVTVDSPRGRASVQIILVK